jgi:superfamily II DNA or RNA helicase
MLVLHGSWMPPYRAHDACFVLWAEDSEGCHALRSRRRKPADPARIRAHPFTVGATALRDVVSRVDARLAAAGSAPLLVRLPSAGGLPLPSPEAGPGPASMEGEPPALAPWRVDALTLDTATAVGLLAALPSRRSLPGYVLSDDLRFWTVTCRFALELLCAQRFFPTIQREKRRHVARWRPLLDGWDEAKRFGVLLAAMPGACRAPAWRVQAPTPEPAEILNNFLDAAVDTVARQAAAAVRTPASYTYSPAQAWLDALTGNPVLESWWIRGYGTYDGYREWARPADLLASRSEPFRLCFALGPPPPDSGGEAPWTLRFLLQSTEDPSLLIPAGDAWRGRGAAARLLRRISGDAREHLLAELVRAAAIVPPIEAGLHEAAPASCPLTATQAYEFLRDHATRLRESGFGVLIPGLGAKLGLRLRLGGRPDTASDGGLGMMGLDALVAFDWQVALGDQTLSREEFEDLVRLKEPLVQVRGQWVELQPEIVEQALDFFKRQTSRGALSVPEALRLALAPDGEGGLPIEAVDTAGWFDDLLQRLRDGGGRETVEEPNGFTGKLRGYQKSGLSWLVTLRRYGLGACLADDMGLGKTPQLIALLLHKRMQGQSSDGRRPSLVICPTSVVGNWRHELTRFAPNLKVLVHHGAGRNKEAFAEEAARNDVVISSYALLHRDEAALASVAWSDVVLDEAQNIKNPSTKAAQTARKLPAGWRAALTGTPVENRLTDLWSIFQFLNPGYLGPHEDFRRRFAGPIERGRDAEAAARLKALVSPFILRRVKTDRAVIADLPEKNEMKVYCTLTREQATLYQAVVKDSLRRIAEAEGLERRGIILAMLTKLKQVCDHPALFLHDGSRLAGRSGKLARLSEMLEEVVAVEDRALVFTQFAQMGGLLKEHLEKTLGREVLFLYGGTPAAERDRMVTAFQQEQGGPAVFVLSIKAGGTGLNLTRANHVFHFDRWWNPAVENQATDRAFRIGQRRDVQVHKFLCAGTLEDTIDQLIERKVQMSEAIVGTNETWITEMTTEQLRDLLLLRRDAIEE